MRLILLNVPRLEAPGGEPHVLERRDAALLAWLTLEGPTPAVRLATLVWPESATPAAAGNNLRQRIFRLRRKLGRDIVISAATPRLAEDIVDDLSAVEQRLAADVEACAGEVLGAFSYDDCPALAEWVSAVRLRWRTQKLAALARIAAQLEAEHRVAPALRYAERLVSEEPTFEPGQRQLMRLHHLRGDQAAALAAYERFRQRLQEEIGTAPDAETRALLDDIQGARRAAVAPPPRAAVILRPPRLVGRDAEWAAIHAALDAGHSVLVCGEPGIGKSRLLSDFATHSGRALFVAAFAGDASTPYALLARLLRAVLMRGVAVPEVWAKTELARLLPELGVPAAGRVELVRLRQAVLHALGAAHSADVRRIVADDLHYADAASLELLPSLAADDGTTGVQWLLGVRTAEMPQPLAEWTAAQSGVPVTIVTLRPLAAAAVQALVESLALPHIDVETLTPALVRHAGGNPLLTLETLRALVTDPLRHQAAGTLALPTAAADLIARRLQQLSPQALALAQAAAVAGQDFSAELAAHVLGCPPIDLAEPWRELEAADILRGDAFAHDLILEATRQSVLAPSAKRLYREIATYLEAHHGQPARVAQHWYEAEEWQRAGNAYLETADAALAASRRGDEVGLLGLAIDCFERAGDTRRLFECTYRCCEAAFYVEHMERVKALVAALLRLAANDAEQAMAHIMQAAEANVLFRATEAESAAHRGLEFARRSGSGLLELRAMQQLAGALARLGRADEGVALMQPLLAGLEQSADAATQRAFLSDYALVLDYANRRADALAVRERVIALATAEEDWSTVHVTLTDQAISSYYLGELEQSTAQYERARSLKERLGAGKGWSAMDDMALAGDLSDLGRYAEALALYEVALTALRRGGFEVWIALTECDLAVTWLHLGQMQRAAHLVQEPRADASPFVRLYYHATCARLQRARQASAREQLQRAIEVAAVAGGRDYLRLKLNTELNREVDPAAGARTLESIAAEAGRRQYFGLQRVALLYRCDCLRRAGVSAEACALAHDVSAAFAQIAPVIVYAGDVWWLLFQAFDAGGDAAAADAALRRGVHWINEVALPNVPAEFRDSFLNRNLTNRALVTAASRRLHS